MIVLKTALCGAVLAAAAAAAPAALAGPPPPPAPPPPSCSVATLQGSYGLSGSGFLMDGTAFAVEGRVVYNGTGKLVATETHFSNGVASPASPTGTYTVNPDCTGTFTITSTSPSSTLNFVIDQGGTHIRAISTTAGGPTLTIEYSQQFPQDQNSQ
jgi:hypothetical protein